MLVLLVILTITLSLGESKRGGHNRCRKMDLKELCESPQGRDCHEYVPDHSRVCHHYRQSTAQKTTNILSSERVPYWDASPPEILVLTNNITVAPGEQFDIQCMAEGAPAPFIEIYFKEDADISELPDSVLSNSADIEKGAVQTTYGQPYAIYDDEGWYRCVAKNSEGVVFQDTYLTVASPQDLCDTVDCESPYVCQPDYELGVAECVCPTCDWENMKWEDMSLFCGTDCAVYTGLCSLEEARCQGYDVDIFHNGACGTFTHPEYSYEEVQETEFEYGEEVVLTCQGTPAGDNPGPQPKIKWYQDWGQDFGGRELVGEGNTLSYTVKYTTDLICVGIHCRESFLQRMETDIKHFHLLLPRTTPTTGTPSLPTTAIHTPEPTTATTATPSPDFLPTTPFPPTHRADSGNACQIMGDPRMSTFDGRWFKQDGVCTYVLAMDCRYAEWFVYGRFTQFGATSSLESLTLYTGMSALELQRGWIINNYGEKMKVTLGQETQFNDISYQFDGETLTLLFGKGNQIRWNGFNGAQILTSPDSQTCGICGDNNGNGADDFTSRFGGKVDQPYSFVSSWGLRQGRACFENEVEVEVTNEAVEACSALFFHPYILRCHDVVPVKEYEVACARSYTTNPYDGWRAECNLLQSYILQCETEGLNLSQWRDRTRCSDLGEVQKFTIGSGCPQENPPV